MLDSDSGMSGLVISENGSPLLELGHGFIATIIRRRQTDRARRFARTHLIPLLQPNLPTAHRQ
ncbi:hypothetical protein ACFXHA_16725 [Nocardia sp. NPDC059240]|uniref:hypothetical protein n=1 Tax=Nocardia sp. NPDC059240 TaxID=3346786 RepID=UPI0036903622